MSAKVLMVQGTASSVGKSLLVTALCRIFRQDGYRVAPFKAQNLALNAAVTRDGLEIGRAQAVQAEAAKVEASADMNPILLKPESGGRCQMVVLGRPIATLTVEESEARKAVLWGVVVSALDRLRSSYDLLVIEGAGSPAEINLRASDIANMRVARYVQAPVLLVGNIDHGGVFAALLGTHDLLEPEEQTLIKGLVVNKFRGDRRLLEPGLRFLEQRIGKPVLGVIPYMPQLRIAEEDSVALDELSSPREGGQLDIVVIRLPHIANFDDFDLLAAEPTVRLRYLERPEALGRPDLVILPGTKSTIADLAFLRTAGLAERIVALAHSGTPVLGICGGYQMLGERLEDPFSVESVVPVAPGLGLLPARTIFLPEKSTVRVRVRALSGDGPFGGLIHTAVEAYEIHMGRTEANGEPLFHVDAEGEAERTDGCRSADGLVFGTYLHGLFEDVAVRRALIGWLGARRGLQLDVGKVPTREMEYDRLAEAVRANLDLATIYQLLGLP
ncbi:MAG: cobyric acid synthase [Chloroflexi bacterium]|nr:cobyric acid synthase [Chloroflexota bacterium]